MLRQRIFTALILIPLFVVLVFSLPALHFSIAMGLILVLGAWEWSGLMGLTSLPKKIIFPFFILLLMIVLLISLHNHYISAPQILELSGVWWLIATALVIFYPKASQVWGQSLVLKALMGVMVLIPCWVSLVLIRIFPSGVYLLFFLFILVWGADTGAYFAGKLWGKTPLIPKVSPGKTWQGVIGGFLTTLTVVILALYFDEASKSIYSSIISLSMMVVLFSVIGDLFESMMKRNAGLKDSGKLLPGHGGILDRIDSLTAAGPIFALGWMKIMFV